MPNRDDTVDPHTTADPYNPEPSKDRPHADTDFGYGRGLSDSANQSDEQGDPAAHNPTS